MSNHQEARRSWTIENHLQICWLRMCLTMTSSGQTRGWVNSTAACETAPQACKWRGAPARKSEPWYDQSCKDTCQHKKHVSQCPQSTAEQIKVTQTRYDYVTSRAKQIWTQQRNDELVEKSNKDSRHFWKVYKTRSETAALSAYPTRKKLSKLSMVLSLLSPHRDLQRQVYLQPVTLMMSVCLPASLQKSCVFALTS